MIHNFSGRVITLKSVRLAERAHAELLQSKDKVLRFRVDSMISGKPAGKLLVEVNRHGVVTPVGLSEL